MYSSSLTIQWSATYVMFRVNVYYQHDEGSTYASEEGDKIDYCEYGGDCASLDGHSKTVKIEN